MEGTDLTNFTVTATLAHARDVLADRRLFMLDAPAWSGFVSVLDRPVSHEPRLEKLFAKPSLFDEWATTARPGRSPPTTRSLLLLIRDARALLDPER